MSGEAGKEKSSEGFKHLVRVHNTDIPGNKQILISMKKIRGIGFMFANAVLNVSNVSADKKSGNLSDDEIKRIEDVIAHPRKYKIPSWMFNRRKDIETGEDIHLLTSDLKFTKENDIKRQRMIKSYVGMRHSAGLPVRGQRTKSNFRRNKGKSSLGVKKK